MAERLGLGPGDLAATEAVLSEHGNMSSVTVLFVLDEILRRSRPEPGALGLLGAFGPGFARRAGPPRVRVSLVDLRARATEPEQLDEGVPEAEALRSLADLRFVNRWLGNRGSLLRAVRPHLPPGGRLLDVGCGSGDVPAFLLARLPGPLLAVGVDVKTLHLRAAPPAVRRVVADVRRLPFPDGAFDVVTASLFLHHFDDEDLPGHPGRALTAWPAARSS